MAPVPACHIVQYITPTPPVSPRSAPRHVLASKSLRHAFHGPLQTLRLQLRLPETSQLVAGIDVVAVAPRQIRAMLALMTESWTWYAITWLVVIARV